MLSLRRNLVRSSFIHMEITRLLLLILVSGVSLISYAAEVPVDEAYVRPAPRKDLSLLRKNSKQSSNPEQVHISLAGAEHIRVTWITTDNLAPSVVEYGLSHGKYSFSAQGESTSYKYLFYSSGKIHNVVIGPLEHNTTYFYKCGGGGPEYQLKTPPAQFPIVFAIVGDLGQTGWTESTLAHIDQCRYDMLLLPGDLSYADYLQSRWDTFGVLVEPLASSKPWMTTEGNHEKESIPLFKEGFQSYNARWKMPFEESSSPSNLFYSFEVAGVHVIMLGSYADYDHQSDQYNWLKDDLAKVNRQMTPWLLAVFHVPWYSSNLAHQGEGADMMAVMESLLYAAGVDIVFAGHVHAYERSDRVAGGKKDICGPVHITIGDGGNREGLAQRYIKPKPDWSVFREASFGHGELNIVNSSHAYWSWHRNDDDEVVIADRVWINSLVNLGCVSNAEHDRRRNILVGL